MQTSRTEMLTGDWKRSLANVFLELTSRCNMNCRFCPFPVLEREKADMPHDLVLKALNELKDLPCDLTFHCLGEPLLNEHFDEYCTICDEKNIHYWLVTNGLILNDERCNKLFSHKNLRSVEISLHTISDRSMRLRGVPIPFFRYLESIKKIVFNKKRLEANIPIRLDVMYDKHLFSEILWRGFDIEEWMAFLDLMDKWRKELDKCFPNAQELKPNFYASRKKIFMRESYYTVRRKELLPTNLFDDLPPHIKWLSWEMFPNVSVTLKKFFIFSPNKKYLKNTFKQNVIVKPANNFLCDFANSLVILSNGMITFCCLDYEGKLSAGNIKHIHLKDAAYSKKRALLLKSPDMFNYCCNCKGDISVL